MTKYIYAFRNVKSGNFGNPTIEVITTIITFFVSKEYIL